MSDPLRDALEAAGDEYRAADEVRTAAMRRVGAAALEANGHVPIREMARITGISHVTLYKLMREDPRTVQLVGLFVEGRPEDRPLRTEAAHTLVEAVAKAVEWRSQQPYNYSIKHHVKGEWVAIPGTEQTPRNHSTREG